MTRLPRRSDEPARTIAVMALIATEIRAHLGGRYAKAQAFDLLRAAKGFEASGYGGTEPVPDYAELYPQSIAASPAAMPDEAAAVAPQLTAASLIVSISNPAKPDPHWPTDARAWVRTNPPRTKAEFEALYMNQPVPDKSPSFSPSFLLPVKQNGGLADCAAICGVSLDWFTRNVDALMKDRLFPNALPETGQRRWALARIREWATNPISTTPLARARAAHAKTMEKQDAAS